MTKTAMNVAIATAVGWKPTTDSGICWDQKGKAIITPPNYTEDLNAMAEAEKVLDAEISTYFEYLTGGDDDYEGCYKAMMATASQRAEAFLKVKGLWQPDAATTKDSEEKE